MTRISAGIRAVELCDRHLRKERIEILRIPNKIKSGKTRLDIPGPNEYKLGKGHEKFFCDKLLYLHNRYIELTKECTERGFKTTDFSSAFEGLPANLYNDWVETDESRSITSHRVNERMESMSLKSPLKYFGENIDYEHIKISA